MATTVRGRRGCGLRAIGEPPQTVRVGRPDDRRVVPGAGGVLRPLADRGRGVGHGRAGPGRPRAPDPSPRSRLQGWILRPLRGIANPTPARYSTLDGIGDK
jgi:hypothetical protein